MGPSFHCKFRGCVHKSTDHTRPGVSTPKDDEVIRFYGKKNWSKFNARISEKWILLIVKNL
jgi:hypothetical protein